MLLAQDSVLGLGRESALVWAKEQEPMNERRQGPRVIGGTDVASGLVGAVADARRRRRAHDAAHVRPGPTGNLWGVR